MPSLRWHPPARPPAPPQCSVAHAAHPSRKLLTLHPSLGGAADPEPHRDSIIHTEEKHAGNPCIKCDRHADNPSPNAVTDPEPPRDTIIHTEEKHADNPCIKCDRHADIPWRNPRPE